MFQGQIVGEIIRRLQDLIFFVIGKKAVMQGSSWRRRFPRQKRLRLHGAFYKQTGRCQQSSILDYPVLVFGAVVEMFFFFSMRTPKIWWDEKIIFNEKTEIIETPSIDHGGNKVHL